MLSTQDLGGVRVTEEQLREMQAGDYVLHARDGGLEKVEVQKTRLPVDPLSHAHCMCLARAPSGTIYAAQRSSDAALTLMVINKTGQPLTSTLSIAGFDSTLAVETYRYSAANLGAIVRDPDQTLLLDDFTRTYPANSITLFVVTPGVPVEWDFFVYLPIVLRTQ